MSSTIFNHFSAPLLNIKCKDAKIYHCKFFLYISEEVMYCQIYWGEALVYYIVSVLKSVATWLLDIALLKGLSVSLYPMSLCATYRMLFFFLPSLFISI